MNKWRIENGYDQTHICRQHNVLAAVIIRSGQSGIRDEDERRRLAENIVSLLDGIKVIDRRQYSPEPQHDKNIRLISEDACKDGVWLDGYKVAKEIELRLSCFGVTLRPDGTYSLSDYSG